MPRKVSNRARCSIMSLVATNRPCRKCPDTRAIILRSGSTSERTSTVPTVAEAESQSNGISQGLYFRLKGESSLTEEGLEQEVVLGRDDSDMPQVGIEMLEDTDRLSTHTIARNPENVSAPLLPQQCQGRSTLTPQPPPTITSFFLPSPLEAIMRSSWSSIKTCATFKCFLPPRSGRSASGSTGRSCGDVCEYVLASYPRRTRSVTPSDAVTTIGETPSANQYGCRR